jgi:DNA-binding YbaB/EbfC family protein
MTPDDDATPDAQGIEHAGAPADAVHPDEVLDADDADAAGADPLAALLGGSGGGGGLDLGALMEQASSMQARMIEAQEAAAEEVVEGVAGGGAVRVVVTGALEFRSVTIDPAAVDPADVEMLQDLVLAAINSAVLQVNQLQQDSMGGLDLGGVDLGGLFGS